MDPKVESNVDAVAGDAGGIEEVPRERGGGTDWVIDSEQAGPATTVMAGNQVQDEVAIRFEEGEAVFVGEDERDLYAEQFVPASRWPSGPLAGSAPRSRLTCGLGE